MSSRSCHNCYRYLVKEPAFVPRSDGKRTAVVQASEKCWVSNEMDGCSEHFFTRLTRFERLLKEEDEDG